MEIHKPKPVHSWRELASEVGVIVIGIVIAISLEQFVEYLHWESEVKMARQAILEEMDANNVNLYGYRIAIQPCVDKQLDQIDAVITAREAGRAPDRLDMLRSNPSSLIRDSEWQSVRASQVLPHFPRAEAALMSRYYAQLPDIHDWMAIEQTTWPELSILQKPAAGPAGSDIGQLQAKLAIARRMEYLVVLNSRRQMRLATQLGVIVTAPDAMRVKNYCDMSADDFERYRTTQELR
jgi:hypothetical protein